MNGTRRVVVTGLGAITGIGCDVPTFWQNLLRGKSGIGRITKFDPTEFRCQVACQVDDFDVTRHISRKESRRIDPFCHYAIGAAEQALSQAGITSDDIDPLRAGVMIGSGVGGITTLQEQGEILIERGPSRSSPLTVPKFIIDMASGVVSIHCGFKGPNLGMVTACASGCHAIGEAMWIIKRGDADVMLTGGTEACIVPLGLTGFMAMRALTSRNDDPEHASRPFDADRDGFIPGEGAGILVMESLDHAQKRNAEILAEIVGYGLSGDAYHITAPAADGLGASEAVKGALRQAEVNPDQVDYINAHGTSTPLNDKVETLALKKALGDEAYNTPVSSTKSMIGHTLGAAGGLESVVCIQAVLNDAVPGTMNYDIPDPDCDLDYVPNESRGIDVNIAMNINLGFGGHNGVLLFRKWR